MPLFLRAILITVPRFILIVGMVIGLNRLDISPLPEWGITVLAYVLHFLITFLCGLWALRGEARSWAQIVGVAAMFLVVGTLWEMGLYAWMTDSGLWEMIKNLGRQSVYLLAMYFVAVLLAGAYNRGRSARLEI